MDARVVDQQVDGFVSEITGSALRGGRADVGQGNAYARSRSLWGPRHRGRAGF